MNDPIHICLISDAAYARRLVVTLASIVCSAAPEDALFFYIIDGGLSAGDKRDIERLKSVKKFSCVYIETDSARMSRFPGHRCSVCAYYRVLLPELLPHLDKIIYLDCDLIVLKSLRELWDTELEEAGVAAARDFIDYVKDEELNYKHQVRIGMDIRLPYFNSGVLLINLAELRAMRFSEVFFRVRKELDTVLRFSDQDVFNHIFQNKLKLLPQGWNFQAPLLMLPEAKLDTLETDIAIIHYTTDAKPWIPNALCLLKKYYSAVEEMVDKIRTQES